MINFSKWIPSSDGSSTFSNFLNWLNTLLENIVNFSNDQTVIFGTYTGDGANSKIINLGFTPVAVEIWSSDGKQGYYNDYAHYSYGGLMFTNNPITCGELIVAEIVDGGFKIYSHYEGGISSDLRYYVNANENNDVYYFKAYKSGQITDII